MTYATWNDVYAALHLRRETPEEQRLWRCITHAPAVDPCPSAENNSVRLNFIMGMVAYHSQQLENAGWDRWELHRDALIEAYELGRKRQPINMFHFLRWHRAILPFGGSLRDCNPVSVGMGESFQPVPYRQLPGVVNSFVRDWTADLNTMLQVAERHFHQWRDHPFGDGNKRHARLMTVYGCGWIDAAPVCITLAHKTEYLDALSSANIDQLADIFIKCQVAF